MADAIQILKDKVERDGASKVSRDLGISRQTIFHVLRGTWKPGRKLLTALGLKKIERVVRVA